ncbi:MAG: Gfo/Idh/MocA family oxidoreductase [Perlabentimonas sp.]
MPKNFSLIGSAGFIAPRHLKAIKETGNNLLATLDKHDCVGIIDSYFPEADFFIEYERFDRHLDKLKRQGIQMDYVSICTPNYLHDSHIRFALRQGAEAICEKPIVLNPWNVDALEEIERETQRKVNTILQLRHHPSIIELKKKVEQAPKDKIFDIDLTYITSRGRWYSISWKGDIHKSGGVATNIGVHFFDMLTWIFGGVNENIVHISEDDKAAGYLSLDRARVRWFLSVNSDDLPKNIAESGQRTFRSIFIEGEEVEFSGGFTDLHTLSYQEILKGNGYGLADARPSIQTVQHIRNTKPVGLTGDYHPFCKK